MKLRTVRSFRDPNVWLAQVIDDHGHVAWEAPGSTPLDATSNLVLELAKDYDSAIQNRNLIL